ncbi:MAG: cation:proton antiporter, partial [Alphaproteobacteria bacterium HGW-Alphaproteobacteria-12]
MFDIIKANLPALQVVVPLVAAPVCAMLGRGGRAWGFATLISFLTFAISVSLFAAAYDGRPISYEMGGWAPPIGIEYRVDALNAFVLMIVSGIAALVMPYARRSVAAEIPAERQVFFYTAFLLCLTGLLGVTITGDAFNVFVFLEISSLSTYALVASGAWRNKRALTAAYNYLIMGTVGATFFVIGIGMLYMITGTLNMADLAVRIAEHGDSRTLRMGFVFIFIGIGLKLAMFPLHLWLPNAYSFAPSAVTSFIAATATKVAVYVLLRFMFTVF